MINAQPWTSATIDSIHAINHCLIQEWRSFYCAVWARFLLLSPITLSPWWRHQMETFSALLPLCARNSPVPVKSPHKGQWRGALMVSLIYAWINDWVNNHEAGNLRRHRGHYDVNVMPWKRAHNTVLSETDEANCSWLHQCHHCDIQCHSALVKILQRPRKYWKRSTRNHFVYAPSQWETTLRCNVVSHWLGAYTKWHCNTPAITRMLIHAICTVFPCYVLYFQHYLRYNLDKCMF